MMKLLACSGQVVYRPHGLLSGVPALLLIEGAFAFLKIGVALSKLKPASQAVASEFSLGLGLETNLGV
jgi:hypothetical protein